jgi:hypothetical protein
MHQLHMLVIITNHYQTEAPVGPVTTKHGKCLVEYVASYCKANFSPSMTVPHPLVTPVTNNRPYETLYVH